MFPQKPAGDHPAAAGDLPARPTESFAMPAKRPILPAGTADASGACMMSKSAKIYGTLALVLIGIPLFLALWSGTSAIMAILLRSEEHTSELQSLMRRSYAVFCLTKNTTKMHHERPQES